MTAPKKHALSLSRLLAEKHSPEASEASVVEDVRSLQLRMLRIQQGIWHAKRRAVLVLEGFDAAGKGGAIRRLTETLDPRSFRVYPIGPPDPVEKLQHYLQRFWERLPEPGIIAIFDRSWYGRVLVERVEKLAPKRRWREAYAEINQFEAMLTNDGIDLVKLFLAIHPQEQLRRFEARLSDPYKQWKLTDDDLAGHAKWQGYVAAAAEMLRLTSAPRARWQLVPADSKPYARREVLKLVTRSLGHHGKWLEDRTQKKKTHALKRALKKLQAARKRWNRR